MSSLQRSPPQVIFPGLLTDDNPNAVMLAEIWPQTVDPRSMEEWYIFGRDFQFKFMPVSFFSKLVTHILYLSPREFYVWKAGLAMRLDKDHLVKLTYQQQRYMLRTLSRHPQHSLERTHTHTVTHRRCIDPLRPGLVVRVRKTVRVQKNEGQLKNVIDAIEFTLLGSFTASLENVQRTGTSPPLFLSVMSCGAGLARLTRHPLLQWSAPTVSARIWIPRRYSRSAPPSAASASRPPYSAAGDSNSRSSRSHPISRLRTCPFWTTSSSARFAAGVRTYA